jgi:hypothetical protein
VSVSFVLLFIIVETTLDVCECWSSGRTLIRVVIEKSRIGASVGPLAVLSFELLKQLGKGRAFCSHLG